MQDDSDLENRAGRSRSEGAYAVPFRFASFPKINNKHLKCLFDKIRIFRLNPTKTGGDKSRSRLFE
jgi:hypothetical protein